MPEPMPISAALPPRMGMSVATARPARPTAFVTNAGRSTPARLGLSSSRPVRIRVAIIETPYTAYAAPVEASSLRSASSGRKAKRAPKLTPNSAVVSIGPRNGRGSEANWAKLKPPLTRPLTPGITRQTRPPARRESAELRKKALWPMPRPQIGHRPPPSTAAEPSPP